MTVESSSSTLPRPQFARLHPAPRRSRSVNDLSQSRRDPARACGLYGTSLLGTQAALWPVGSQTLHFPHPSLTQCTMERPPAPALHPRGERAQVCTAAMCVTCWMPKPHVFGEKSSSNIYLFLVSNGMRHSQGIFSSLWLGGKLWGMHYFVDKAEFIG